MDKERKLHQNLHFWCKDKFFNFISLSESLFVLGLDSMISTLQNVVTAQVTDTTRMTIKKIFL